MIDLGLYRENKQLKKRIAELEKELEDMKTKENELLIQSLNLYLTENNKIDDFFKFVKKTTYAKCVGTENTLLKRWEDL